MYWLEVAMPRRRINDMGTSPSSATDIPYAIII